uniref:Uncharacterized protein n=1 Tax=Acrobeloides nanus TaxID=290746 RepID=A0A914DIH8_9BILA
MKQTAQRVTDLPITQAVITVPAYFNQAQKEATLTAAKLAQLEVIQLITEPAAAAFAYGVDQRGYNNYNILVFDLGGGTFDQIDSIVRNTIKDADLAEQDIDEILLMGGSSRIPYIKEMLGRIFPGKKLNESSNPDEAVALGAAIYAAQCEGHFQTVKLIEATPMSIGTDLDGLYFVKMSSYVGIDLGAGYSRIAVATEHEVKILRGLTEDRLLSSIVSFKPDEILIGKPALSNSHENIIFDACRVNPFSKSNNSSQICKWYTIHQEQDFAGHYHRKLIINAAKAANIEEPVLINHSTAIAYAYLASKPWISKDSKNILILNCGASSTSVSIFKLSLENGMNLDSMSGKVDLGGEDFTNKLIAKYVNKIQKEYDRDCNNPKGIKFIREACERAKKELSLCLDTE